jgi:hypothetical protein
MIPGKKPPVMRQSWRVGTARRDFGELSRAAVRGRLGEATLPVPDPPGGRPGAGGATAAQFGSIWFNLAQLGSSCGSKQALRGGSGDVLGTEAKDLADALLFLLAWTSGSWLSQERRSWAISPFWGRWLSCWRTGRGEPGDFAVARHRGPGERGICFHAGQ